MVGACLIAGFLSAQVLSKSSEPLTVLSSVPSGRRTVVSVWLWSPNRLKSWSCRFSTCGNKISPSQIQIQLTHLVTVMRSVPSDSLALLCSSTLPSGSWITLRDMEDPKEKLSDRPPEPPGIFKDICKKKCVFFSSTHIYQEGNSMIMCGQGKTHRMPELLGVPETGKAGENPRKQSAGK